MPSQGSTPDRGRDPRRRPLIAACGAVAALALVALATAWPSGDPVSAPGGATERAEREGASPAGGPPWALAERAAGAVARRATNISMRRLRVALRAAQRQGSPIAIVRESTALRARPQGETLATLGTETEFGSPRVLAVVGHDRQWLEVMAAELSNGETGWVRADDVEVEWTTYSLHAGLGERTLEVRRAGRVVRRVPVAVGAPETPTPTGRFAVTDKLEVTDESPYGCCALAFTGHQPDVPQEWAGGDRLAVHGTPHPESIGDAASLGCFRAQEADMRWLIDRVPLGTVVTVTP